MTFIFVPSNSHVEAEVSASECGAEGYFTLQARNRAGRVVRERTFKAESFDRSIGPFHNLILNQGIDRLGSTTANNIYSQCIVGVGTLAPAVNQTALANFVGALSSPQYSRGNGGEPDYYSWMRTSWTSAVGALGNNNLSEVGIGSSPTNNNNLFSRELIRDAQGVPTVFPISSDEQLTVTYELRLYPPLTDTPATITVGSTSYDTITRPRSITGSGWGFAFANTSSVNFAGTNCSLFTGDMPDMFSTANIAGGLGNANTVNAAPYAPNSLTRDISATWTINSGNGAARTAIMSYICCAFMVRYDPVLVKNNTQTMTLNHRVSWARR